MDIGRVEKIVKYSVAFASLLDDWKDRELGPIHLVKHVYLADLAYALENNGESYTGTIWRFHHFGPWSPEVFKQLDPSLSGYHFRKKELTSKYDKDYVRWSLKERDSQQIQELGKSIPLHCAIAVERALREFGSDTYSLLQMVYRTKPMIKAKPGEVLVFPQKEMATIWQEPPEDNNPALRKRLRKKMKELKAQRADKPKSEGWVGDQSTLAQGLEWLSDLEQSEFSECSIAVEFDQGIWDIDSRDVDE